MNSFLICTPAETTWRISPEQFDELLRRRWPAVEVRHHPEPGRVYPVDATVTEGEPYPFILGLEQDGSTVFVEGSVDQAAVVAQWWREQAPAEEQLIFFDQSYTAQVDLTRETSTDQIVAPFKSE